jgi:catechol 2,3-dioxygenase-like lactoylglutathione lyase family enzyme
MIRWLDHVNLRTADVEGLARFYVEVIGLRRGERPPFPFSGAWLYAGERAIVHLVEDVEPHSPGGAALSLEHFALAADGLEAFLARLDALAVAYRRSQQIGSSGKTVINLRDPDGNRLHIDFDPEPDPKAR